MSDSTQPSDAAATETPQDQQSTTPPASAPDQPSESRPTETVEFWKQKAREQETRAKANADAAKRLQEIEDAQKSEQQRHEEAAARAKKEAEEARADAIRYRAAATHKVDEDYFDLLGYGDEEAIGGRAQRVGELLAAKAENEQLKAELEALRAGKPAPGSTRPVASLRPGATAEPVAPAVDDSYPSHWLPQRQQ